MKYSQKIFLSQFDQQIRKYIIEYCKRFIRDEYDVYILLARKAACFLTVLEDLEFISFNGTVVSDRVLEYDTSWLIGKRVAIIDDTIISGTTIYKIVKRLKEIGVSSVSIHAFCINDYWFVEDLLNIDGESCLRQPYMRVSHTSSIRFCRQIVNALSIIPRPYNIDFPVCEIGKLSKSQFLTLIEDDSWEIVRTTTRLQELYDVESASLTFKADLLADFNDSIGCDISCLYFAKLRLFLKELSDNSDKSYVKYTCKVVPYVMFNPISVDFANYMIASICQVEKIDETLLQKDLRTPGAKLLFIQYYFAIRLFRWWSARTGILLNKTLGNKVNKRSQNLLFSPSILELVDQFSYTEKLHIELSVVENEINQSEKYKERAYKKAQGGLTSQFLYLYYTKELPARRKVRKDGCRAFHEKDYTSIINRLNDGLSVSDLSKCVPPDIMSPIHKTSYLSTFLDHAIDKGIIVPITRVRDNRLCRAYRHGEEVIWGDSNDKMLAIFFKELTKGANRIPKLIFEKMLVLFLKIGLRMDILDEYNMEAPVAVKNDIIGIRSYLFGQVSEYYTVNPYDSFDKSPILDPDTKSYWTSHRLQHLGLIVDDKKAGFLLQFDKMDYARYSDDRVAGEATDIDPEIEDKVLTMAEIFSECLEKKFLTSDGLVELTSCINPQDNTASIGAELCIFSKQLNQYLNKLDGALRFGNLNVELLKELRRPVKKTGADTIFLWTAVNSGKDKYFSYKTGKGIALLNKIKTQLMHSNSLAGRQWENYWRKDKELVNTCDSELNDLNETMGILLIDIRTTLICQHVLLYDLLRRNQNLEKYIKSLQEELFVIDEEVGHLKDTKDGDKTSGLDELKKRKLSIQRDIKIITGYAEHNIKQIEDDLNLLNEQQLDLLKSQNLHSFVTNKLFLGCTEDVLLAKLSESEEVLGDLKYDADVALKDFSALIPQWGKLRKTVRYNSLMHINTSSQDYALRIRIGEIVKAELANFEVEEYGDNCMNKSIVLLRIDNAKSGGNGYILAAKGQRHDERLMKLGCNILKRCVSQKLNVTLALLPECLAIEVKAYFNPQTKLFDRVKDNLYIEMPQVNEENCLLISVTSERKSLAFYNDALIRYQLYDSFKIESLKKSEKSNIYRIKMEKRKKKIFISYSRKDAGFRDAVKNFLKPLQRLDIVDTWSCDELLPGKWDDQIQAQLDESDIVVYLLSANFFGSPYILEKEVANIINGKSQKKIICIIVSEFTELDTISEYITNNFETITDRQRALMEVKNFQYLPYGKKMNTITKQEEEFIVPLKDFNSVTGKSVESALRQLSDKILQII